MPSIIETIAFDYKAIDIVDLISPNKWDNHLLAQRGSAQDAGLS
jgi:hypothetical protein